MVFYRLRYCSDGYLSAFHPDLDRLSVDIELRCFGTATLEAMESERTLVDAATDPLPASGLLRSDDERALK